MTGSDDKKHPPLSGEDAELWSRVAAQAEPLPALRRARHVETRRVRAPKADDPAPAPAKKPTAAKPETNPASPVNATKRLARPAAKKLPTPDARLDPKSKRRLARGTIAIDARIDLHGLTAARARTRLTGFLTAAAQARNKWVLVITGKGRAGDGVLRREVPLWIGQPPLDRLVIAYEPAAAAHGGDGALYLRLRAKSGARG